MKCTLFYWRKLNLHSFYEVFPDSLMKSYPFLCVPIVLFYTPIIVRVTYFYYSKSDIYLCYIDVTWCYSLFSYYFPTRQILEGIHQCCIFLVSSSPLQCLGKSTWLHVWMIVSLLKASYRRQNLKRALEMDNTLVRWEWHSD